MNEKHLYTSEQKKEWFGEGIWCDEHDECKFEWVGLKCVVIRLIVFENNGSVFGGYFCAYVEIPETHSLHKNEDSDLNFDVHGGVTYNENSLIGFDCAHSFDEVPSMKNMRQLIRSDVINQFNDVTHRFNFDLSKSPIFNHTYRTIDYAIEETKKLAEQIAIM